MHCGKLCQEWWGFDVFLHRGELWIWVYVDEIYVFFCLNMWRNNVDICHNYMFKHVIMPMNKNVMRENET